ncbi:hypothetical protein B0H11DRAFT_2054541 [Mycena galericulata]|nr:hypothetical protein B0H11DRAFT_2054541 [Mycena galericulata]
MFSGHHQHAHPNNMALLVHAPSSPTDSETVPAPRSGAAFDNQQGRELSINDTTTTIIYEPAPPTAILRASQVTLPPGSPTPIVGPTSQARISDRELAFVMTAAFFGMGVLLLGASIAHWIRKRRRGRPSGGADIHEQGLGAPRNFDDSTWGTRADEKHSRFQGYTAEPPRLPTPLPLPPCFSLPKVAPVEEIQTPTTELTAILEQFEQRLHQEETDIALALHIAFGDELSGTRDCAPFFAGSEDDVTTMLSLQAGMESVGKRAGGIRNRGRQGSDASASSQSTTVTLEGFSSDSSASSLTSMESILSDIEESAEEAEEDVVYEVKRAQTHSMEIQKGKLITWQPGGVRLMVTGPSSTTLGTASSSFSVDLDQFPLPP